MENSVLSKDLKSLTLRAPKSLVFRGCFFFIIYISPRGQLSNVRYTGMCHRPGSIFQLQKSRTGPKFLKFYSRTGPTFSSFTQEQDPFLTIWSPTPRLKCQKSQLLSSFVSCSLMSSFLFCKVFQAFYNWDQFESGHMYSSLNLT